MRNIGEADLDFSDTLNFLYGSNGAGKTSILEAVYLLARAKTFRKANTKALVQQDFSTLTIFAEVQKQGEKTTKIGFQKRGSDTEVRINGETVHRLSELAKTLPVSLITPQSHRILEEGPEHRRRMLSWGVFHVEQEFRKTAAAYNRALIQRNALLKQKIANTREWDNLIVKYGEEISRLHKRYFSLWVDHVLEISSCRKAYENLEIYYYPGWDEKYTLGEMLNDKCEADKKRGWTSVGPHRADVIVKIKGRPVSETISRGQQKMLLTILLIAQSRMLLQAFGENAVFLLDDLHAELDRDAQNFILEQLKKEGCQSIITSIERHPNRSEMLSDAFMFHVEHGEVERTD